MSAILAIFNRKGLPVETEVLERMLTAVPERAADGQAEWCAGPVALGHQHFWLLPEELGEQQPLIDETGDLVITCDARLDNRQELIARLEIDPLTGRNLSEARLILRAYQRWGEDCVRQLLGDFAFVIWDASKRQLYNILNLVRAVHK